MRLVERLELSGQELPLVRSHVSLGLNRVGVAWFEVRDDGTWKVSDAQSALCRYWVGWDDGMLTCVFLGALRACNQQDPGVFHLTVRELSAALEMPLALALRHVTPIDTLGALTAACGIEFATAPGAPYLGILQPYYACQGTARTALQALGPAYDLDTPVWMQQPDGRVYWGEWEDCGANLDPIAIDPAIVLEADAKARALTIPVIPNLRPGRVVQADVSFMVRRLTIDGARMRLEWDTVPGE